MIADPNIAATWPLWAVKLLGRIRALPEIRPADTRP